MTWGWSKHQIATKIIRKKNILIATCGSSAAAYAIEKRFSEPAMLADHDEWLLSSVPDAIRSAMSSARLLESENSVETFGCTLILGTAWGLYSMCSKFGVYPAESGYVGHGSGGETAAGSLYTSGQTDWDPKKRLKVAVGAANKWAVGCGGDVRIEKIGGEA